MDDKFFAKLREIQKKERANSSLARVGADFFKRTHKYIDSIRDVARGDPFSEESDLLKNVQRIATEICERREHKITDAAVMNIHRSYHLFKGKPKFDLRDTTPLNLTNEEEKLYYSLIETLKSHRQNISLDKLTEGLEDDSIKKSKLNNVFKNNSHDLNLSKDGIANDLIKDNNVLNNKKKQGNVEKAIPTEDGTDENYSNDKTSKNSNHETYSNDKVLTRLNEIKKAKVIEDEHYETIDKQVNKPLKKSQANETIDKQVNKPLKKSQANESITKDLKENGTNKTVTSSKSEFSKTKLEKSIKNPDLDTILKDEDKQFAELNDENPNYNLDLDEPKSLSKDEKIVNETILIFRKVGAIVGVDEKTYGPFYPQDIVVMPNVNGNIIIKNKKGRLIKI